MVALVGWIVFLAMFLYFTHKGIKILEHFLERQAIAQSNDELFRYMLERHWEAWAKTKGIEVRKESQKTFFKSNKKSQDKGMGK